MNRTVGIILVVAATIILLVGGVWLASGVLSGRMGIAGGVLGFAILLGVLVGPLAGFGVISMVRGRKEAAEQSMAEKQRKILDMVKTRGRVNISDVIIELQSSQPAVRDMIYRLVGMGVFSGYVVWDEGVLYSAEASQLKGMEQCANCGGELTLAGKGVIKCPYCGTEYFLS